jgi:hypothetical protein
MRYYDTSKPARRNAPGCDRQGLSGIYFKGQKYFPKKGQTWLRAPGIGPLQQAKRELAQYFAGRRKRFEVASIPMARRFNGRYGNR